MKKQVADNVARLEKVTKKKLGDPKNPLLVSVRSGSARSMPGMMETILNLGLNDKSVEGLAEVTKNERFAYDAYRRFVQMYSTVVMGMSKEDLEHRLRALKTAPGREGRYRGSRQRLERTRRRVQGVLTRRQAGKPFPEDPMEQLWGAIGAVFGSWMAEKAVTYRRVEKITGLLGTGVNVQQMVFGNTGDNSGTGVCFTRDPSSGEKIFYGDYLTNAQGEDVVAGIRTPVHLTELAKIMPKAYSQLEKVRVKLEKHYTRHAGHGVHRRRRQALHAADPHRQAHPAAAFKIAMDMANEKLITKEEALMRIKPEDIERLFYPVIDVKVDKKSLASRILAHGINAVPGAAVGKICLSAAEAEAWAAKGEKVILVRRETSPEDVGGMAVAQGILTATGGKTTSRGSGCAWMGQVLHRWRGDSLDIDYKAKTVTIAKSRQNGEGRRLADARWQRRHRLQRGNAAGDPGIAEGVLQTIMKWADSIRTLRVRTNADTPQDARKAIEFGAEGIGLCRTEHMFFTDFEHPEKSHERQLAIQEMILANDKESRVKALDKLLPFQRRDFVGIFQAMDGFPVTIRLIDPPLHEFVPHDHAKQAELAKELGISVETVAAPR